MMVQQQDAKEILTQILDDAKVPVLRRRHGCAERELAFAEVNGDEISAKILVAVNSPFLEVRVYACGSEFLGIAPPEHVGGVIEAAADFIRRWVDWEPVKIDLESVLDELEDDIAGLMDS